jgi:hypothetical protein
LIRGRPHKVRERRKKTKKKTEITKKKNSEKIHNTEPGPDGRKGGVIWENFITNLFGRSSGGKPPLLIEQSLRLVRNVLFRLNGMVAPWCHHVDVQTRKMVLSRLNKDQLKEEEVWTRGFHNVKSDYICQRFDPTNYIILKSIINMRKCINLYA